MADLVARDAWIERAAPGAAKDFDRLGGIGAAAEHPQEFFRIGDVDVVVDYDDVAAEVRARAALARNHARLTRMTGVTLLDRNNGQESAARRMAPHAFDIGHAGFVHRVPDERGAH